jgi:hypothetical protein
VGTSLYAEWAFAKGRVVPFLGGRVALMVMSRRFEGEGAALPEQHFSTFSPGLVGGLRYDLAYGFSVTARARLHYLLYNVGETRSLGYWELGALVGYEL